MIIERGFEALNELGTEKVGLDGLIDRAYEMENHWRDDFVTANCVVPVSLTRDMRAVYRTDDGRHMETDLTDTAFSQLCTKAGVPGGYVRKCFESGRDDLAVKNFDSWAGAITEEPVTMRVRVYDNVMRAALSMQYRPFDHPEILEGVSRAIRNDGRYEANQAYLSPDRMHIRFVDFNHPLNVRGDQLYSGFTVSSSNIGTAAFAIKYFLYRFVCRNGLVRVQHGGILFRQTHLRDFLDDGETLFRKAIDQMHTIDELTEKQIGIAASKKLTAEELSFCLTKAQKDLSLGQKRREKMAEMIGTVYDPTMWGVINAVTETAQELTLDSRVEAETWAGNMLDMAA